MTLRMPEFHAKIKTAINVLIKFNYCMVYREELVPKKTSVELNAVLRYTFNSQFLQIYVQKFVSEYNMILLFTQVHWLSRKQVLKRLLLL